MELYKPGIYIIITMAVLVLAAVYAGADVAF